MCGCALPFRCRLRLALPLPRVVAPYVAFAEVASHVITQHLRFSTLHSFAFAKPRLAALLLRESLPGRAFASDDGASLRLGLAHFESHRSTLLMPHLRRLAVLCLRYE